jgi:hypothetical protein
MKKARPQVYGQEEALLKDLNPEWQYEDDEENTKLNQLRSKEDAKQQMMQGIADEIYGSTQGMGYLRAPNAIGRGYLSPPQGGFFQIPLMLASLLPALFGKGGKRGRGMMQPVFLTRHPNLSSASSFYRDISQQAVGSGIPQAFMNKKMSKLFGGSATYRSIMTGKIGSGVQDKLLMGHLLSPLLLGHLKTALKGTGVSPEHLMAEIDENFPQIMDQEVTPEVLAKGGSIVGSLWSGVKNIFGKLAPIVKNIFTNPKVKEIGKNVLGKITSVAEKQAPELAELASNKIAQYARKKLTGEEPEVRAKKGEEEEEAVVPRRKTSTSAIEELELPSGQSDSALRKRLASERRAQTEPSFEVENPAGRKIVGYRFGNPIYGVGKKKTAKGGAWSVRLTRD